MTRRELNLAIFEGTADTVLWQPRLETWISHHMTRETLPARYRGMSNLEIYDAMGCSIRYDANAGIERVDDTGDLERIQEQSPDRSVEGWRTPAGEIRTVYQDIWEDGNRGQPPHRGVPGAERRRSARGCRPSGAPAVPRRSPEVRRRRGQGRTPG